MIALFFLAQLVIYGGCVFLVGFFVNKISVHGGVKWSIYWLLVCSPFLYQMSVYHLVGLKKDELCEKDAGFIFNKPIPYGVVSYKKSLDSHGDITWRLLVDKRQSHLIVDDGKKGSKSFRKPGVHEVYLEDANSPNCSDFNAWNEKNKIYRRRPLPFDTKYCVAIRDPSYLLVDTTVIKSHSENHTTYLGYDVFQDEYILKNAVTNEPYINFKDYNFKNRAELNVFTLFFLGGRTCFTKMEKDSMGTVTENFYFPNFKGVN